MLNNINNINNINKYQHPSLSCIFSALSVPLSSLQCTWAHLQDCLQEATREHRTHPHRFQQSLELQVSLSGVDPYRDKRLNSKVCLPFLCRPKQPVTLIMDTDDPSPSAQNLISQAETCGVRILSVYVMKSWKKNRRVIKKNWKQFGHILCMRSLIRRIPRLLGPGFGRIRGFPHIYNPAEESLAAAAARGRSEIMWNPSRKSRCLSAVVGCAGAPPHQLFINTVFALEALILKLPPGAAISVVAKISMGTPVRLLNVSSPWKCKKMNYRTHIQAEQKREKRREWMEKKMENVAQLKAAHKKQLRRQRKKERRTAARARCTESARAQSRINSLDSIDAAGHNDSIEPDYSNYPLLT